MALWCNGVDLTAVTETDVCSWDESGMIFDGSNRAVKPDLIVVSFSDEEMSHRQFFKNCTENNRSAHVYIDHEGQIFQFADLWSHRCVYDSGQSHRSIEIVLQNRSKPTPLKKYPRGVMQMIVDGDERFVLTTTTGQLDALEFVVDLICKSIKIPLELPGKDDAPFIGLLPRGKRFSFTGVVGAMHLCGGIAPGEQVLNELWNYAESVRLNEELKEFSDD